MKRSQPKRKTELQRSDPAKIRAWRQSSAAKRKRRQPMPQQVRMQARQRSLGRCVVCVWEGKPRAGKAEHLHHVMDVQMFPDLELEPDNLVGLCLQHHANHHAAFERVPREALPECCLILALEVGDRAVDHLKRFYPFATTRREAA